jgi:glycerol-3-phosphate acyltransferase PlsY
VPFGLLLGKIKGLDLRQYGSGRTGAANTLRTLGLRASLLVFLGDLSKGLIAVLLARLLLQSPGVEVLAALCAVAGHNWPVYIGFRGGRGVATSMGALIPMSPPLAGVGTVIFVLVIGLSRYISLGSILASAAIPILFLPLVFLGRSPWEYLLYSLVAATLIVAQHRDNISRLRAGTERRLGDKAEPVTES